MNQETIIQVMKFIRDTCKASENCKGCPFRIYNNSTYVCGFAVIPSGWNLNEVRPWKAFKE